MTYLDTILTAHREAAAADGRPLESLLDEARACPPARGFRAALEADAARGALAVIAEVKRRSPSKGGIKTDLDPSSLAAAYARGGAACLSVLTDIAFFGGSAADLQSARSAVTVPVLRKDFTVSAHDVADARIMGADAVLLIAAALDTSELRDLHALGIELGLDVLVEVHDEGEIERSLDVDATLIGVNQRDLVTFAVDTERAERVAAHLPDGVVRVAESGITGPDDGARLAAAGYHAVLVGESLVRSEDPERSVRLLRDARK